LTTLAKTSQGPLLAALFIFSVFFSALRADSTPSHELRTKKRNSLHGGLEVLSTWIPYKKTLSYTRHYNEQWSFEFEYAFATLGDPIGFIDLASISEKRYSLLAKRFVTNSLSLNVGLALTNYNARLGSDILSALDPSIPHTSSSISIQNISLAIGLSQLWIWDNGFSLGLDLFRLNLPVIVKDADTKVLGSISNQDDLKDVKRVVGILGRVPTFGVAGINLGYTF